MKKKGLIIASLLVLVMSFVFLGCPPADDDPVVEEPDPAELTEPAKAALAEFYTGTFPLPAGTTFDTFSKSSDGSQLGISWKDASLEKFTAYKTAWGDKVNTSISIARNIAVDIENTATLSLNSNSYATIAFTAKGGTDGADTSFNVAENSIYIIIYKD